MAGGLVSFWILLQVVMDLVMVAGVAALWLRLKRPAQDDPRMSKGLQLLQTKISVIEDLSDRTETQVSQVTALLESKIKEVQSLIIESEKMNQKIEVAMQKSLEVAKIFQDRIPHQEIVERQNTIKYVKAARMAHQGASVDEIANAVDLSRGEIEFIAKVNRNNLQFSEENLPEWAREAGGASAHAPVPAPMPAPIAAQPLAKKEDQVTLSALGDRFRKAIHETTPIQVQIPAQPALMPAPQQQQQPQMMVAQPAPMQMAPIMQRPAPPANPAFIAQNSKGQDVEVRKVLFPRVNAD